MRHYLPAVVMLVVLLAGCGGWQGPTTGHAVGYIYVDEGADTAHDGADTVHDGADTAQAQSATLRLLPAATADPDLHPVSGATVTIVQVSRSTVTTVDGSFGIFNIEPGTYSLRVTHPTYGARQWQVNIEAGYTTFGESVLRPNGGVPVYDDYDYFWSWDDYYDDWSYWDDSGGYVPEPPPTNDTIDDGGGLSSAQET